MTLRTNLVGQRFGKLFVLSEVKERHGAHVFWECRCDCGNVVSRPTYSLRLGRQKTCGCPLLSTAERLLLSIEPIPESGCWIWTGVLDRGGYGKLSVSGEMRRAHRVSYESFIGKIPNGLGLDHLCRVRCCINPWHLEPVTSKENLRRGNGVTGVNFRKTHCYNGHEFSADNTYIDKENFRHCRMCDVLRKRKINVA